MNFNIKNLKIYIYIIGIVIGAILYNYIDMDFSFIENKSIEVNFFTYFCFVIIDGIKFLLIIYFIKLIDRNSIINLIISGFLCVFIGGSFTLFLLSDNTVLINTFIEYISKIIICNFATKRTDIKIISTLVFVIVISALIQYLFLKIL